jgi:hypothetical protein
MQKFGFLKGTSRPPSRGESSPSPDFSHRERWGLVVGAMRTGGLERPRGGFAGIAGMREPPLLRGALAGYVDYALSGSSGRGRRVEPGVGDPVFAVVGEG